MPPITAMESNVSDSQSTVHPNPYEYRRFFDSLCHFLVSTLNYIRWRLTYRISYSKLNFHTLYNKFVFFCGVKLRWLFTPRVLQFISVRHKMAI